MCFCGVGGIARSTRRKRTFRKSLIDNKQQSYFTPPIRHQHDTMQKLYYRIVTRNDRPAPDGRCPLVLQAFINKARVRITLGISIDPKQYDENRMQCRRNVDPEQAHRINTYLSKIKAKCEDIIFNALNTDQLLTAEKFEEAFQVSAPAGDFLGFMLQEIERAKPGQAPGTIKAWMSTYNHLARFQPKIGFGELSLEFVRRFDVYLRKLGQDHNYIQKHHRFLRKYILLANRKGKRIPNPYTDFKIREKEKEREYLTAQEVTGLYNLYQAAVLKPHLQRTLRHFLFMVGTSVRYSDLEALTKENIVGGILVFTPVKTQKKGALVRCPISDMAAQMLAESESENQKLFAVLPEQTMNRYLKDIAAFAGMGKKFTTHMGRHTYGYLFIASGGQVEVLQKIMGHSDIKTTMIYTHIDTAQIRAGVENINRLLSRVEE